MKFLKEMTKVSDDTAIRNTIGRVLSANHMATMLNRLYNVNFSVEDTSPYVKTFNTAMRSIDPYAEDEVEQARFLWKRLYQELSHPRKRPIPR